MKDNWKWNLFYFWLDWLIHSWTMKQSNQPTQHQPTNQFNAGPQLRRVEWLLKLMGLSELWIEFGLLCLSLSGLWPPAERQATSPERRQKQRNKPNEMSNEWSQTPHNPIHSLSSTPSIHESKDELIESWMKEERVIGLALPSLFHFFAESEGSQPAKKEEGSGREGG